MSPRPCSRQAAPARSSSVKRRGGSSAMRSRASRSKSTRAKPPCGDCSSSYRALHRSCGASTPRWSAATASSPSCGRPSSARRRERRAQLFTVLGEAGIGKTRLARELASSLAGEASVLTGRCLSYGEGITFWPLREIVEQAAGGRTLTDLLAGEERAEVIADRLGAALGQAEGAVAAEETFWAFRKLFEALAGEQPLVLCLRGRPLGRAYPARPRRAPRRLDPRGSSAARLPCPPRAARSTPGLGRWQGQRDVDPARATLAGRQHGARRRAGRGASPRRRDSGRSRQRRETRSSSSRCSPCSPRTAAATARCTLPPAIHALLASRLERLSAEERRPPRASVRRGRKLPRRRGGGPLARGGAPARRRRGSRVSSARNSSRP